MYDYKKPSAWIDQFESMEMKWKVEKKVRLKYKWKESVIGEMRNQNRDKEGKIEANKIKEDWI